MTIGLVSLFLYSESIELESVTIIDEIPAEEVVKMQGTVKKISQQENVLFLTLQGFQEVETEAILFTDKEIRLQEGDFIEVQGEVEEYRGEKEVIVNWIKKN